MLEEKWYCARQSLPGAMIRCKHGTNPACVCVRRFDVDKHSPLTEQQIITGAASLELNRIKRLGIEDDRKYRLLSLIAQCKEDEHDPYIKEYELLYVPLVTKKITKVPESHPLTHSRNHNRLNIVLVVFIILIAFSMLLYCNFNYSQLA